jgi:hypothetical protein
MGPPGSLKGLCVYDWDKCKAPVPPAVSPTKLKRLQRVAAGDVLEAVPPAPKKTVCNMTVQVRQPHARRSRRPHSHHRNSNVSVSRQRERFTTAERWQQAIGGGA